MPSADVAGTPLHHVDLGAATSARPPLVLLHAFPLHSGMWSPQLACLSATRRVIAPDLPGFGRSAEAPPGAAAPTMAGYADQVADLLRSLEVERVVLGGLSMGGYVAFAFLRRHPGMVAGLVLADTRPSADTAEVFERRTRQQEQVAAGGTEAVVEALLQGLLGEHTHRHRAPLVAQVRRLMDECSPADMVGALEAMKRREDATGDLAGIGVPTVVLVGEEDRLSTPEEVQGWQPRIPGSRLVVLPEAGHLSNLEAADGFNAAVGDLLEQV